MDTRIRIRGRKGQKLRIQRLAREPMCRDCRAKGILRLASVPDHIIPLAQGGTDTDNNVRCLCDECHRKRTAEQFGMKYRPAIGKDGWPLE
jgi:5-methylcytosine-specific restriction protein A